MFKNVEINNNILQIIRTKFFYSSNAHFSYYVSSSYKL